MFNYQVSWNSVHAYGRTDRRDEDNSRFSHLDAPNMEPIFVLFTQTQKVSITQVGNFVETRPLAVALNQADGKQGNKTFAFYFELRIRTTELNRKKKWFKRERQRYIAIKTYFNLILLLLFRNHYARYLQLYTWNKACVYGIQCCSCSVFTVCATCNVISPVQYIL